MDHEINIIPVNLTITVPLKSKLLLEAISRLLVCTPVPEFNYVERGGVPFFGVENIIVGNKSEKWESSGVRCQGKNGNSGAMKNCISIDYQIAEKNFNVKIYSDKFHMVGIDSIDTVKKIVTGVIDTLNSLNKVWIKFFRLSLDARKAFIKTHIFPLVFYEGKNGAIKNIDDEFWRVYNEKRKEIPYMRNVVKCFLSFIYTCDTRDKMVEKLRNVCIMEVGDLSVFTSEKSVEFKKIMILDGTYMGNINRENILLGHTAVELRKEGSDATFHNQKGKYVRVTSNTGLENRIIKKTSSKLPLHQINVFDSGHCRVNSPGNIEQVFSEVKRVLTIVLGIIENSKHLEDTQEAVNIRIRQNIFEFRAHKASLLTPK